ncbi:replication initiator [Streptomyces sp. MS19]|uniref:replication initiator n=1 Tax=Streptomyces sp. MS19 TaxID=3385972 RepID=UPI0039A1569D
MGGVVWGAGRPAGGVVGRPVLDLVGADLVRVAQEPGALASLAGTGGCEWPVWVRGRVPGAGGWGGRLAVRCGTRRARVCQPCARLHAGDTYRLVRGGLERGGDGDGRLWFVTLTAPGFGVVHRSGPGGCVRGRGSCRHGRARGCGVVHGEGSAVVGSPLCAGCYDYGGHVLWQAMVGELWARTVRGVRRRLAEAGGVPRSRLGDVARVEFAKVAEYQARGAVHFHVLFRLDGPEGAGLCRLGPPGWAVDAFAGAVERAAADAWVGLPDGRVARWGAQRDVREVRQGGREIAGYLAKYVSKSVGDSGGTDFRVRSAAEIGARRVSGHVRDLMWACWRLGGRREFAGLGLRRWAHTLGFRGHVLSKSRNFSLTYSALREQRRQWRAADSGSTVVVGVEWAYAGSGLSPAEDLIARGVRLDSAVAREFASAARREWRSGYG